MKKKNRNKIYIHIMYSIVLILISSTLTLKAQKQWKKIEEGNFQINYSNRIGDLVVMTASYNNGNNPTLVNGQYSLHPLQIWDLSGDSFININNNWSGDPLNTIYTFKENDTVYFISDKEIMYRAVVSFENKEIEYKKVFQGQENQSNDSKVIYGAFLGGKKNLYFFGHHYIHIFDMNGNFLKSIRNSEKGVGGATGSVTSVVEWNDTVFFGYDYIGGLSDGSGLSILDIETSKITKQEDKVFSGNLSGCSVYVVDQEFYLISNPGRFDFQQSLFRYSDGNWVPIIINCGHPVTQDGRTLIVIGENGHYYNGDTIHNFDHGFHYEFPDKFTNLIGKLVLPDPRLDLRFSEEFYTEFWQKYRFTAFVQFIYDVGERTIGIGTNLVSELIDPTLGLIKLNTNLTFYPNPVINIIHIENLPKETDISIVNISGEILFKETTDLVDVSSLNSGIYFIIIKGFKPQKFYKI